MGSGWGGIGPNLERGDEQLVAVDGEAKNFELPVELTV